MNKSNINKVLIISLLLIWSVVGYKLISNFFGKNIDNSIRTATVPIDEYVKAEKKDIFNLPIISRDPFLGKYTVSNKKIPVNKPNRKVIKTVQLIWPSIEYYGFLKGEKSNGFLILLKINNKLERIRKGKKLKGLEIKEIYQDSILISFEGEKKIFVKM